MDRTECPLLRVPVEIRLNIYDYLIPDHSHFHVHLGQDSATLSKCVNPDPKFDANSSGDYPYTGYERRNAEKRQCTISYTDRVWARRLRSAWGPHWMCEEQSQSSEGRVDASVLLNVCRMMHSEILDLLARITVLHITDLETIDQLDYANISPFPSPLQNIRNLTITLRLPLHFFLSLEEPQDGEQELERRAWCKLDKILHQLNELRALRLCLDHDGTDTWSLVNERILLESIIKLASSKDLAILVILPKLHPKYEREDRHFTHSLVKKPFPIRRMLRQQYHGIPNGIDENGQEKFKVEDVPDFPILADFMDFLDGYSLEKCEVEEREMWARGLDVEWFRKDFYREMAGMEAGCNI